MTNNLIKALEQDFIQKLVVEPDEDAYIFVVKGWLPSKQATALHNKLVKEIKWENHAVRMPTGYIQQPRETYACGDKDVKSHYYSGQVTPVHEWNTDVKEVTDRLMDESKISFNAALLNKYDNGQKYISWHSDKEIDAQNQVVATISLGGTRKFSVRKIDDHNWVKDVYLENGDVCIMRGKGAQSKYEHTIRKTTTQVDCRISITLRKLKIQS